ncbi:MAG: multiheme c-type cytochrome [bacterium]
MKKKTLTIITIFAVLLIMASWFIYKIVGPVYQEMQAGKIPHYEIGEHLGAEKCGECHEEIYNQWSQNSAHAVATTNEPFLNFKDKFTGNFAFNAMMGESMCYACHGSKEINEGVNCETCHGTVIPDDVSIEETHERKYSPGRARLKSQEFCAGCHTMKSPFSGDPILSLYFEWQKSEAAKRGITCQGCHMQPRGSDELYHGFDSVSRNIDIYRDDLSLHDIELNFPRLILTIKNHVLGHAIPAVGPSRILVLEVSVLNSDGVEILSIVRTFGKYYELMPLMGIMPNKLIENSQLQSGETRSLSFSLPASTKGRISKALFTLRFYDVSDDHQGDITKAHWISEPFLTEEVNL